MNGTTVPAAPLPLSRWVVPGIVAIVALFDACFYDRSSAPGLSVAVFFAGAGWMISLNRTKAQMDGRARMILLLLAGSAAEAVVETGVCNVLLLMALTLALAAETWFVRRLRGLDRWSAQVRACVLAPFRAMRVAMVLTGQWILRRGLTGRIGAAVVIVVPTLVLLLIFGELLCGANAVFGLWAKLAFNWTWAFLPDLSPARIILWVVTAVGAVALLWPSEAPDKSWNWQGRFARWPDIVPAPLALTASAVMLAALNGMFLVANAADALFLWQGARLPTGVNYSEFVHDGVDFLICTVLLSAVVLASIFNQSAAVAGRWWLKALGGLWIAQNLFLVLSTARRLERYLEAYGATVERLSTLIFLMLVAVGFGLLAMMIARGKPLAWLVGRSALAAFATLYLAQFLNLGGWVAAYNVTRWEVDRSRNLDLCYLRELGPAAWPALARAKRDGAVVEDDRTGSNAWDWVRQNEDEHPRTRLDHGHWREFSLRARWNRKALEIP